MTAQEIQKFRLETIGGRVDGSLDKENFNNYILAEIAAQLAELNERLRGVIEMRDVDRAKVYSEHLGKKLSDGQK